MISKRSLTASLALLACITAPAFAEAPNLKTPAPVIYLADNLDEVDRLGWCIDTRGRGFAENLQVHSCKPQGGDVQFAVDSDSGQIRSVEFADYCMEYVPSADPVFALRTCDATAQGQRFSYDESARAISPADAPDQCVVAGAESRRAGPFMSRPLLMAACNAAPAELREWIVLSE